ncbi:DNA-3-methyladenine glycosylase 2 family protein [Paracoccaceae bacterium]|jgi:DNA-3-methyladenine glycosylase II|nr:DNA-3-methyladenine glycosylase 2 family protein [Paracoccaceae bacterium]
MDRLESDADIDRGIKFLCRQEPAFARAAARINAPIPLRRRAGGFDALLKAIVAQQLSVASAAAIWARAEAAGFTQAQRILSTSDVTLREVGLSRQKIKYVRALALADVDFDALAASSTEDVVGILTQISGIGVWTAEIYAMFSLGHQDVFPSGDLALQEAAKDLFGMTDRPSANALKTMAVDWSPWRAVAAHVLWAYYSAIKKREGIG